MQQHWVPESYLFAWTDPDSPAGFEPYVWVFERESREGRKRAPRKIFREPDFYSDPSKPKPQRDKVETGLSCLEGQFRDLRERKLRHLKALTTRDKGVLIAFTATMHTRSRQHRAHQQEQWGSLRTFMEEFAASVERLSPDKRRELARMTIKSNGPSLSMAQVRALAEKPTQHAFPAYTRAESRILAKMPCVIFVTDSEPGFITSDSPCVHVDPKWELRPPMFRGGMASRTFEVTLPLSPGLALFFSWGLERSFGYLDAPPLVVDEINRRTRSACERHYVVRRNVTRDCWFEGRGNSEPGEAD